MPSTSSTQSRPARKPRVLETSLLQEDFRNIKNHVENADAIMFNLGFLPGSDRKIKLRIMIRRKRHSRPQDSEYWWRHDHCLYTQHAGGWKNFDNQSPP